MPLPSYCSYSGFCPGIAARLPDISHRLLPSGLNGGLKQSWFVALHKGVHQHDTFVCKRYGTMVFPFPRCGRHIPWRSAGTSALGPFRRWGVTWDPSDRDGVSLLPHPGLELGLFGSSAMMAEPRDLVRESKLRAPSPTPVPCVLCPGQGTLPPPSHQGPAGHPILSFVFASKNKVVPDEPTGTGSGRSTWWWIRAWGAGAVRWRRP